MLRPARLAGAALALFAALLGAAIALLSAGDAQAQTPPSASAPRMVVLELFNVDT